MFLNCTFKNTEKAVPNLLLKIEEETACNNFLLIGQYVKCMDNIVLNYVYKKWVKLFRTNFISLSMCKGGKSLLGTENTELSLKSFSFLEFFFFFQNWYKIRSMYENEINNY